MSYDIVQHAPRDVRLRSVLHALGMIAAAFIAGLGLAIAGLNVLFLVGYTLEADALLVNVTGTVLQFVGFIIAVLVYVRFAGERDLIPVRVPGVRDIAWMIAGFVGVFVVSYAVSIVLTLLGLEAAQNAAITQGQENPDYFLYLIPIAVVLVGPGEELLFRGVVQGQLRRAFGPIPAIVAASALFGAVHVVALGDLSILLSSAALVYISVAAALGAVLGTVYEYAETIVVPAVIHGLWNAMLFAVNWYIVVYDVQLPA